MDDSLTDVVDLNELTVEFSNESPRGQETTWANIREKYDDRCHPHPQVSPEDRLAGVASNYLEDKHAILQDFVEINLRPEQTDMLVSEDEDYLSMSVLTPAKHGDRDVHFKPISTTTDHENSDVVSLSMFSTTENEKNSSISLSILPLTEKGDNEDFFVSVSSSVDHANTDVYSRSMLPPAEPGGKEALLFSKLPFTEQNDFDAAFVVPNRPVSFSKLPSTEDGNSDSDFAVPDEQVPFSSKLPSIEHGDSDSNFIVPDGPVPFSKLPSIEHEDSDSDFVVPDGPIPFSKLRSTEDEDSDSEFVVPDRPVFLSSGKTLLEHGKEKNSETSDITSQEFLPGSFNPVTSLNMLPSQPSQIQIHAASTFKHYSVQLSSHDIQVSQNNQVEGQSCSTTYQDVSSMPTDKQKLVNIKAGSIDEKHQRPIISTTEADWEDIQTVQPEFVHLSHGISALPVPESKPLAVFSDVWLQFENDNYSSVKNQIRTSIDRQGFSALKHFLFGPPKLHRDLLLQKECIFCIAATQFDNSQERHLRVLQTIYRTLTGSRFDCQRFGGHWEEIGFQGRDPATDLRGTGMLALLQLLFFLQSSKTRDLARDVYKLSLHPTQNFPFCIMSINLTRICLQLLRADVLNKECNRRKDVTSTFHDIYAALSLRLYREWRTGKTIADSGFVLKDLELYCQKNSKNILKDLSKFEKENQNGQRRKSSEAELTFLNVCKEEKKG